MTINELNKLKGMDEKGLLETIIKMAESGKEDVDKVLSGRNFKYAAVRTRALMKDIMIVCVAIRDEVLKRKTDKTGMIRDILDKEIEKAEKERERKIRKAEERRKNKEDAKK